MIASQFADLSKRIFPKLQNIVEKERASAMVQTHLLA